MNPSQNPELAQAIRQDILSSLHCALPGRIETYDPAARTASVRPSVRPASGPALPLLRDVPVFLPLPDLMTVSPGDFCLLVFADYAIDGWFSGQSDADPEIDRYHDLSDAFAFVGFRPPA